MAFLEEELGEDVVGAVAQDGEAAAIVGVALRELLCEEAEVGVGDLPCNWRSSVLLSTNVDICKIAGRAIGLNCSLQAQLVGGPERPA
jgi:hypothetical protein